MPHTEGEIHILLAVTGSVAAIKAPLLVPLLRKLEIPGHVVKIEVVTTEHAKHFYTLPEEVKVWNDSEEWTEWRRIGDPVIHIELRRWADIMVIAPLDANTMAKACVGICDNLLTCTIRAWDLERPLVFAPAMNTHMYEHPLTREQIQRMKSFGYIEIPSVYKKLACGDVGYGAMAEVGTIADCVFDQILKRVVGKSWKKIH